VIVDQDDLIAVEYPIRTEALENIDGERGCDIRSHQEIHLGKYVVSRPDGTLAGVSRHDLFYNCHAHSMNPDS
jgi:hypothetical protein